MKFKNLENYCTRHQLLYKDTTKEDTPSAEVCFRRGDWHHLERFALAYDWDYAETYSKDDPIIAKVYFFKDISKVNPLLTQDIIDRLPPLYSCEDDMNPPIIARFYNAGGRGEWYLIEGQEQEDGTFLCFGGAEIFEQELGYWLMEDLEEMSVTIGHNIIRDEDFKPCRLNDIKKW